MGEIKGSRRDFYSRFSKVNQTIRRLAVVACLILGISSSLQADEVLYYYGSTLPGESMRPQSSDPQALCGIIANGQAYRPGRAELISFELVEAGRVINDRTHFCRGRYEHVHAAFRNAGRVSQATYYIFRAFETDAANIHMCPTGDVVDHATDCPILPPSTDQTVCAGNPIDFRGGIKRESKTDYLAGGAFPLLVRRYYSSEDHALLDDWRFSYSTVGVRTLLIAPFGKLDTVWAASPNGAVLVYTSGEGNTYTATTDVIAQLVRLGNGWQFTDEDDNVATYDSSGKVAQVTTRQGLSHFYSYDDASVTITDDYGNKLIVNKNNNDEVISVTLPDNNRINYSYNFDGSYTFKEVLETVTYQDGRSVTYHYENPTNTSFLTGVTDERGVRYSTFGYDDNGRANSTEHTGGVDRYSFVYGDMDVAVTSPLGKVTEHTFENIQGSPKITRSDRLGSAFCGASSGSYTFDDNGYVNSKTDWEGNTTSFVRDNLGLVRSATQADGTTIERTVSTQWHTQFRLPEIITEPGQTTTYTYAPYNDPNYTQMHVTDISSGDTRTWSYTYDSVGRPLTIDGPRTDVSDITSYTYYNCSSGGACGQISTAVNALGHTTTFDAYNVHGQPTQITDSNGQVTTLSYNSRQWMTQVTVAGAVTTITYDAKGNITRVTQPDGAYLNSNWDDADRLTAVSDAEGNRVEWTLDAAGNRTIEITKDPGGQIRKSLNTSFDELSRVRAMVYAHGGTANYAYDNNSNLTTSTDPSNRVTSSNFDALDRLIKTIDPLLGETDYVYDDRDNLISVTDAEGLTTSYTYNGFDEPVIVRSPDTGTTTMNYDSAGNVVTQTDARGIQVSYSYDALNRVTQMSYPDAAKNVSYSYDQGANGTGRLTQIRDESGSTDFGYDARGNTTSVVYTIDGQSYAQSYTYNAADRLTGMTYPSGRSVSYGYDISARINQVTSVSDEGSETLASNITRLPFGPASGLTLGNGVSQSKTYDQDYRVLTIANESVFEKGYAYNAVNNITAITDVLDTANSQLFSYDDLDRLEFAAGGYGDDDYSYDAIGNRLSTARDNQSENYQYSGGSHRLQGRGAINYSHDAVGNTLAGNGASFSYDDRNRMDSATTDGLTTTYTHNAIGQRVLKNVAGSQIHYVYDLDGRVIMEATGSGDVQVEYSYLDGEPLVMWREPTEVAGANLAQAGIASQSSTGFGGAASRAIDGNTSGAYRQGSVTHTNSEGQPWWEVSLAERSTISGVVLYNRTDGCCTARLTNVHVFVSEQPFGDQTLAELLARSDIAHAYLPGVQGSEVGVPITGAGSYVRVQLAGTGALSLAEVEVFGEPINAPLETNLSLSGAASQSSTGFGGAASRAIDGNTSGAYRQGSVTHTNNQSQPWWEVSLEERSTINAVKLYNRTDCCTSRLTNVHVFISEQPFGDQTLAELLARSDIAHAYLPGVQGSEVDVPITGAGSYVRVQLAGTGALSLAEVEVFGVPSLAPPDSNLSLSGVASQSSTGFAGAASRAIDGNTSGVYSQGSVTHTNNQSEPWWEVSLEERSTINGVSLYNRTDGCCTARLTNVHVFISEQPFGSQTLTELLARDDIAHAYLSGTQGSEIEVPIAGVGNYVRVQLAGTGVLSLAEVEVLGYGHSALGGQ